MGLSSLSKYQDWGMVALRVAIGVIFLYHGMTKWPLNPEAPWYMMIVAVAEPIGGAALLLGLLTRWASLGLCVIMLGAIYMKMTGFGSAALDAMGTFAPQGRTGWEFDLMILAGCVALVFLGGGRYSADHALLKGKA
jgi:putative oxidoreductase